MARRLATPFLLLLLHSICACGGGGGSGDGDDDDPGADAAPPAYDPFAEMPDTGEGLVNVSADLDALLEHGALATACDDYAADPDDRKKRLLCGKAMFFYESFGTDGVPEPLVGWLLDSFPDEVGPGFAELGLVADPTSAESLPLGLAPGPKLGQVDTLSFTCASCHFARLPDGRYAVGAPNHAFRYGTMNLYIALVAALAIPGANEADHHPDAVARVKPLRDKMAADPAIQQALFTALLPLIQGGGTAPAFSKESEGYYAHWLDGTMDFMIEPLPMNDEVHTISKISSLWGFADADELAMLGMDSLHLGWTGSTQSIMNFLRGFVDLGGGELAAWPDDRLGPLRDYVHSLRAPANPSPPAAAEVAAGATLFVSLGCADCHDGPRGMGRRLYDYDEIGTDEAMKWWADGPDQDGQLCCGLELQPGDSITNKVKSPRLVGLWALGRFLHNGSLDSLEQLLCLEPRPMVSEPAFGADGHTFACDAAEADRRALIAFLRSH